MSNSENLEEEYDKPNPYSKLINRSFAFIFIYAFISIAWRAYVIKMYKRHVSAEPIYPFNAHSFVSNNSNPFISLPYKFYRPISRLIEQIYFIK